MAKARPVPGLGPDIPLREAAGRTIEVRSAEVFEFERGVLDTGDIERVHDMRVATRRLRAALEAFRPCFSSPEFKPALREVKDLADALGARRDPDVALAAIGEIAKRLPPAARAGIDSFEDELRADQLAGNERLEEALTRAAPFALEPDQGDDVTFAEHAAAMIDKRRRRLRKRGDRAVASGKADDLHDTRIAAKRLRYVYEIAEPCFGTSAKRGAKTARGLQDVLGEIHDCDVMSERIRARAEATALDDQRYSGLEALATYFEARRRVLHRQYVDMWKEIEL